MLHFLQQRAWLSTSIPVKLNFGYKGHCLICTLAGMPASHACLLLPYKDARDNIANNHQVHGLAKLK
jgi:hypothetical protein